MIDRTTKLRVRRKLKRRRRQVEDIGVQTEEHFDRHFIKRLTRLLDVRRFVIGWITFLVILTIGVTLQLQALGNYYQELQPAPGGTYSEGMVGSFTNASPLYATSSVDTTVSRLVFAGLLKYDSSNQLVGDLASSWSVDGEGKVYTVKLRPGLTWQDGQALTAADVVFTFHTIQNPDAKSPLFHAWRGIDIKANDDQTVVFTLSNTLAPFIYSLTTGIIPKHSLNETTPSQLRSSPFNTVHPIGAGPFSWDTVEVIANGSDPNLQHIGLKAFAGYHEGRPKLDQFVVKTYSSEEQLVSSFHKQEINSLVGLDSLPDTFIKENDIQEHTTPLTAETGVFLRTDSELLKDAKIRQALVQAVDVPEIISGLQHPALKANSPLLRGQLGYNNSFTQLPKNIEQANKLLDEAGWTRTANDPIRSKDNQKLKLKFFAPNNADYSYVSHQIQKAWKAIGVDTQVTLPTDTDLQDTINSRSYDALLYGISVGVDPDVFAYWHSSQADPRATSRLNFSDYKSDTADKSLEAGRSRIDPGLRAAKYEPFLQSWRNDAPAIVLYQPTFLYIVRGQLFGFDPKSVNTAADRFNNVENWMIRQDYGLKPR